MITLRPYQSSIIDRTREALRHTPSVLIHSPTGSGKTALAAFMLGSARARGKRSWFIAHRDFLLEQTALTFDKVGIPYGFIAAGRFQDKHELVQICSIGTLQRRLARYLPPDLIVWDECHHIAAQSYRRVYEWAVGSRHIGLTATPCRLDGKGLDEFFGEIVPGPTTRELIEQGYLSPYRAYAPSAPKLDGVHTLAGDYKRDEIDLIMDDGQIIGDMVRHYREKADGKKAIYFCVSVKHSQNVAALFNAAGICACHIDGTCTTDARLLAARAFAAGQIQVLTNCEIFGEGFDLATQFGDDATVEAVGLARPTQSLALHLQQIGRSLRPKSEPAIILDHAGNLMRHGLPDDEREWSLAGVDRRRSRDTGPPVRQCMQCFAVHAAALSACPYCGGVYITADREVEEINGELAEVTEIRRCKPDPERQTARKFDDLVTLAKQRGYRNPEKWATHVYLAREKKAQKRIEEQARAML